MEGKRGSEYLLKSVSNIDFNPRIYHTISTSEAENATFERLIEKGTHVFIQIMPQNDKVEMKGLLEGRSKE
ncbi:PTS mannose transporter subunit IIB [Secundilactobacillus oryzae JCM 18671]|uniref:PTS mannose transporter subunit IIB n=1 Tax=Secundilactobacillus oryzae JCM 18671 TaxID=1291743 RepID=A0A081BKP6_9LACO|nr:PTS mannose transporter subunit IIB [Secundilactobacillus oryzae JCM 18671]